METVGTAGLPSDTNQALVYLIGVLVVGVMSALTFTIKAWSQARAANAAVNNVGPGEHRLYDQIGHLSDAIQRIETKQNDFDTKGWPTLPSDMNTAAGLTEVIRDIQHELHVVNTRLAAHDEWERTVKH